MTFDRRDVRRGMDVYTLDDAYLGTVVWVRGRSPAPKAAARRQEDRANEGSAVSGELLGPMPTADLGNGGPRAQSARRAYATGDALGEPLSGGARVVVLRTPLGTDLRDLLPRLRQIPIDLVQTVSLERILLRVTAADLHPT